MAVTNLNGELQAAAHSSESHGHDGSVVPPAFKGKGTRSAPDHSRRHSLPLHFLPQNLWNANSSRASLIESEEAARGEHILDEATVAHRISALRQLNGATRTKHQYAKSTGARNSTFSQPVIVRTYSGTRPQSRQREPPTKKEVPTMGRAELPPVEAFSFKGIMESIQSGVTEDLERIAEICARSRYSLSNQYEVHMPPHGEGDPFLRTPGHAALQATSSSVSGPTLQAIGSDDEHSKPARRSGRPRTKSMAYGTLETIMSSSRSSEEEKERKKSAAVIAEEVRGRASRKAASVSDDLNGHADDERAPRTNHPRSRSTTFASLMIENAQSGKGDTTNHIVSPTALLSEPARPQTSLAEHDHPLMDDASTMTSVDIDPLMTAKPSLARKDSRASTLRPDMGSRLSVLSSFSSWLPWNRSLNPITGNTDVMRSTSHAEGSLRDLLKASDGDRKGKELSRQVNLSVTEDPSLAYPKMAKDADMDILSAVSSLLKSGKYSDLRIKCRDKTFHVHRAIVLLRSRPLAAAIEHPFLEAATGEIHLPEDDPDIVKCMIEFLYTSQYDDCLLPKPTSPFNSFASIAARAKPHGPLTINVKVYIIGDKLNIPALKKLAKEKYEHHVANGWTTPVFTESIRLLYSNTLSNDRPLRDVVKRVAWEHWRELRLRLDFNYLLESHPDIGWDILDGLADQCMKI